MPVGGVIDAGAPAAPVVGAAVLIEEEKVCLSILKA